MEHSPSETLSSEGNTNTCNQSLLPPECLQPCFPLHGYSSSGKGTLLCPVFKRAPRRCAIRRAAAPRPARFPLWPPPAEAAVTQKPLQTASSHDATGHSIRCGVPHRLNKYSHNRILNGNLQSKPWRQRRFYMEILTEGLSKRPTGKERSKVAT